jgi:hypothetical protein
MSPLNLTCSLNPKNSFADKLSAFLANEFEAYPYLSLPRADLSSL